MMKVQNPLLLRLFLAILAMLPLQLNAAENDYAMETFYKDATYTHFINSMTEHYSFLSSCVPSHNAKLTVYAMYVFKKHPDFASNVVGDFSSFDSCQQEVICKSLIAAGFTNEANKIDEKYNNACQATDKLNLKQINNMQLLNNIETYEDEKLQATIIDSSWAAYFATGDEQHIAKMVEYVRVHEGQSEHALAISAIQTDASIHAQRDPTIDQIITKQQGQQHCFR